MHNNIVSGSKVYFGTMAGVVVSSDAKHVSVLMENGRYRNKLPVKALLLNPRWKVTSEIVADDIIATYRNANLALTDANYAVKVELCDQDGNVSQHIVSVNVPANKSLDDKVRESIKHKKRVASVRVIESRLSDDQVL